MDDWLNQPRSVHETAAVDASPVPLGGSVVLLLRRVAECGDGAGQPTALGLHMQQDALDG